MNLPADVKIPIAKTEAAIRDGSGLLLRFPVEKLRAGVFAAMGANGRPIAAGSRVQADGKDVAWVGREGEVYLETLPTTPVLRIIPADGGAACQVSLGSVPPQAGIVRLGSLSCQ